MISCRVLLIDQEGSFFKVNTIPGQAQKLSLPKPCKKSDKQRQLILVPFDGTEECAYILGVHNFEFLLLNLRKSCSLRRIDTKITVDFCLLQSSVQRTMNVFDRLGGKTVFVDQLVVKVLNLMGR